MPRVLGYPRVFFAQLAVKYRGTRVFNFRQTPQSWSRKNCVVKLKIAPVDAPPSTTYGCTISGIVPHAEHACVHSPPLRTLVEP